ncbi:MAG: glycosyltransferase family 4 protein [Pseudomonadota bacterium]
MKSPYDIEQTSFAVCLLLSKRARSYDIIHTQDPLAARILDKCNRLGLFKPRVLLAHGTEETEEFLARLSLVQHLAPHHMGKLNPETNTSARCFFVPNFVDTQRFFPGANSELRKKLGISESAFVVLTTAAVKRHHKRIDYLIDEFVRFEAKADKESHLVIIGASTDETTELVDGATAACPGRIHFLLDQEHEEIPSILGLGDLFVLCSLKEMMPIALLEAISSGLPSLVSKHPVVNWMIGPGGESIAMEEKRALEIALHKWSDPTLRHTAGEQARAHAIELFSKKNVLDKLVDIYRAILL